MGVVRNLLQDIKIPKFYKLQNHLDGTHVEDVAQAVRDALAREGTLDRIKPGKTVCFTASSREIANSAVILRTMAEEFKRVGAKPVVVPAMGSHGGAKAEGQKAILDHYGITEETIGCPIHSCMDTVEIGKTEDGLSVHMDAFAVSCDYVVPTGRIKAHTDFHGPFESGIMKMMAIGLGKQHGADICHIMGMPAMAQNVPAFGRVALKNVSIPFCVGIVENAFHQTHTIAAIPNECVEKEEPELLLLSKSLMPKVPFKQVDVLMVEQIGKEISGDGMDPNVIGRDFWYHKVQPFIQKVGVLDLSKKTGTNFNGIAMADSTTKRLFDKMSFEETYPNNITAVTPEGAKIPPVMDTDKLCFQLCLKTCWGLPPEGGWRCVWIKDTLHMGEFYISESLYEEAKADPQFTVEDAPYECGFDKDENFIGFLPIK